VNIQKEYELFEEILLANPDFDESLLLKDEDGNYEDSDIDDQLGFFQAGIEVAEREARMNAQAQAVPEGFVLVPIESLKVALFWMNEDIDPWQMGGDSFADLFEHKPILEKALVKTQEQDHD